MTAALPIILGCCTVYKQCGAQELHHIHRCGEVCRRVSHGTFCCQACSWFITACMTLGVVLERSVGSCVFGLCLRWPLRRVVLEPFNGLTHCTRAASSRGVSKLVDIIII